MEAHVVVDLGFGDSGKGVTVDSLCIDAKNPLVIRYTSGHQVGHTVYTDSLTSHVHQNYGSGTLRGVPTYYTEHCTMYLNTMVIEKNVLALLGITNPKVTFHPLAIVATPYDIAFNRVNDENLTHGSVGMGVGATMTRHEQKNYKLFVIDLLNIELLKVKLSKIEEYYNQILMPYSKRIKDQFKDYVQTYIAEFLENVANIKNLFTVEDYGYIHDFETLIFEGGQGVMLDRDHGIFPNVTYAYTTSRNAEIILAKIKLLRPNLRVNYYLLTRAYTTRHGNGWMPDEDTVIELQNTDMEINTNCKYQGIFRTSPFNRETVDYAIGVVKCYSPLKVHNTTLIIGNYDQLSNEEDRKLVTNYLLGTKYHTLLRASHISRKIYHYKNIKFQKY